MGVEFFSVLDGYFMFSFPYEQYSLQLFASISESHLLFLLPSLVPELNFLNFEKRSVWYVHTVM